MDQEAVVSRVETLRAYTEGYSIHNTSDSAEPFLERRHSAESLSWEGSLAHLDVTAGAEGFGVV